MKRRCFTLLAAVFGLAFPARCVGANFNDLAIHRAPMDQVIMADDIQRVELLLNRGVDPNARDANGAPLLSIAARSNRVAVIELLITRGATVDARGADGKTALHEAAYFGRLGAAAALIEHGADVNSMTNGRMRPLNYAVVNNHPKVAQLLRTAGALPFTDISLSLGQTAVFLSAKIQEYFAVVEVFLPAKVGVIIVDEAHGNTDAQWNAYQGTSLLLGDNDEIARNGVILSEGTPRNTKISTEALYKAQPRPKDCLIRAVLDSFLITGYIATEWRLRDANPIYGIEDEEIYNMSRRLALTGSMVARTPIQVGRNKSMADASMAVLAERKIPILFIGGYHMHPDDRLVYKKGLVAARKLAKPTLLQRVIANGNLGVAEYFRRSDVGYIYLESGAASRFVRDEVSLLDVERGERWWSLVKSQNSSDYNEYMTEAAEDGRKSAMSECYTK